MVPYFFKLLLPVAESDKNAIKLLKLQPAAWHENFLAALNMNLITFSQFPSDEGYLSRTAVKRVNFFLVCKVRTTMTYRAIIHTELRN